MREAVQVKATGTMKQGQSDESENGMHPSKIGILHIPHSSCSIPTDERVRLAINDTELKPSCFG